MYALKKDDYKIYYIWLSSAINRSYAVYRELVEAFGSVYDIYTADCDDYAYLGGRAERYIEALCDKNISDAVKITDYCSLSGISIVTYEDEVYPSLLKDIENPPLVLYIRGKMPDFERKLHIAVVGTRSMTDYGKCVAYNIGYSLSKNGAVVVSGMALGNDSVAMCAALDAGAGCIGVLGCGVDIAYPPQHAYFMRQVANKGALISEYPPGTRAEPKHFPQRNRIISGLCRATLLVEGDKKSGAMITARCAEAQGRKLYAVPGKVGERSSEGALALIGEGAAVATCANDILKEYAFLYRGKIDLRTHEEYSSEKIDTLLSAREIKAGKTKIDAPRPPSRQTSGQGQRTESKKESNRPVRVSIFDSFKLKTKKSAESTEDLAGNEKQNKTACLSPELLRVYEKLPKNEIFAADDAEKYGVGVKEFLSAVTMLEIYGLARAYPGGRYTVE